MAALTGSDGAMLTAPTARPVEAPRTPGSGSRSEAGARGAQASRLLCPAHRDRGARGSIDRSSIARSAGSRSPSCRYRRCCRATCWPRRPPPRRRRGERTTAVTRAVRARLSVAWTDDLVRITTRGHVEDVLRRSVHRILATWKRAVQSSSSTVRQVLASRRSRERLASAWRPRAWRFRSIGYSLSPIPPTR